MTEAKAELTIGAERPKDEKRSLSFTCCCGERARIQVRHKGDDPAAIGKALAAKCQEKHGGCQAAVAAKSARPPVSGPSLEDHESKEPPQKQRKSESRALTLANQNLKAANSELQKLRADLAAKTEELRIIKMHSTKQETRRSKMIDLDNRDFFTPKDDRYLREAMTHETTGLVGSVRYYADGSATKRDQLIIKLIHTMKCR